LEINFVAVVNKIFILLSLSPTLLGQAEKGGAKFKKKLGGASLRPLIKKKW